MSFAKEVWAKLSQLDVNGKTEKKQNLTYLVNIVTGKQIGRAHV